MSFGIPVRNGLGIGLLPSTAISTLRIGGRPALILNFIGTDSLDSRITFTRALNTATRINSSGLVEIVNANVPRFDYDPVTLAPKGILIEEQRTNLLRYSAQLEIGAWGKTRATVTANATVAPDGASTADKIVEDATASSTHFITQIIAFTAGTTYILSAYVKSGERNWFDIQLPSALMGTIRNAFFDVSNGTVGTVTSGVTAAITSVGNGWYRCSLTFTPTASVSTSFAFLLADADNSISYTGNGTSGLFVWGAQLEAGAFPTSYIPTTTASLTRNADVATMTGTNFSSWYAATQGTFVSQFTTSNVASTATVLDANDATANESIRLRTVTTNPTFTVTDGGVDQANIDAGTVAANTAYKMAGTYAANDFAASISGGAAATDVSGTLPTVNQLQIGASAAGSILNGCIGSITYYNTRLSNTTLRVLTV